MAGRGKPGTDYAERHVAVSVAAAVAYNELLPARTGKPYDAEHFAAMLDFVAAALAKLAPIYVDGAADTPRQLGVQEMEGVRIYRGATRLALADGTVFEKFTMRSRDARDAIVILRRAGFHSIVAQDLSRQTAPSGSKSGGKPQ